MSSISPKPAPPPIWEMPPTRSLVLTSHHPNNQATTCPVAAPPTQALGLTLPPTRLSPGLTETPLTSLCFCSCPQGSEFIQRPEPLKQHHLDHTTPSSKLSRAVPAPSVKSQVPTVASRSPLATPVSSHPATSQRAAPQAVPGLSLASGPFHVLFFYLECTPAHPTFPEWLTLVPPESGHLVEVTPSHTSPTSAFAAPVTT